MFWPILCLSYGLIKIVLWQLHQCWDLLGSVFPPHLSEGCDLRRIHLDQSEMNAVAEMDAVADGPNMKISHLKRINNNNDNVNNGSYIKWP